MNRETRRKLSQNGEIEKIVARAVDECMDEVREATRHDAYRNAFAAMLLACYFPANLYRGCAGGGW